MGFWRSSCLHGCLECFRLHKPSSRENEIWHSCGLSRLEVDRYGRQVVLPSFGPEGQKKLLEGSVLVVGAGGLGCPVALYLAAAGVGRLGLVDADTVALSNLHRQIGHLGRRFLGMNKAKSLACSCHAINEEVQIEVHSSRLNQLEEAAELISCYDLVIDCTDAPPSRYLLNDGALRAARPLIAASAVGLSGQLAVYNFEGGPCLRCVFPVLASPADAEPVASCEEHGVLGPIVGTVGSLAALEAIKVLVKDSALHKSCLRGKLLLFDPTSSLQPCRTVRIKRQPDCAGCAPKDGASPPMPLTCAIALPQEGISISPQELHARLVAHEPTVLLDVRPRAHYAVTRLHAAINWPLTEMIRSSEDKDQKLKELGAGNSMVVCVCRRGNDSLNATLLLREAGIAAWNLQGGLQQLMAVSPTRDLPALT